MPITVEKAILIDNAIEKFFKAIGRAERFRNRINRLAEENYKTFLPKVRAWMQFTNKEINKAFSKKYIRKSIEFQKDKAIDITTKLLDWEALDENGKRMLKPTGLDIMAKSGDGAYKIAGIEASFDILNPEAVKAVDRICSKLVKEVGKETKQAINHLIREGIKEGKSMGKIAKELRSLVGLTERQVKAVVNYEKWLLKKRPDLSDLKRAQWVERYNKKLHRYRTEMIARTESMRATNEGQLITYKEAGYEKVEWSANVGACPRCDMMNGHRFTVEEARGMLPDHPDCRCSWLPIKEVRPRNEARLARESMMKAYGKEWEKYGAYGDKRNEYSRKYYDLKRKEPSVYDPEYKIWQEELKKLEGSIKGLSDKQERLLRDIPQMLRERLYVSKKGFELPTRGVAPRLSKEGLKNVKEGISEFSRFVDQKLIPEKIKIGVGEIPPEFTRAHYYKHAIYVRDEELKRVIVHESGHWLEAVNSDVRAKVQAFYNARTKGEVAKKLIDGYGPFEVFKKDKFFDPYMGKVYDDASEILSMGLGYFHKDPITLALKDPEYFDFIYNLARGL